MKKQPIKLYEVRVVALTGTRCETGWHTIEVAAKHQTTAMRLAADSAARRSRVPLSRVEAYECRLIKSTDWTAERVYRYK